MMKKSTAPFWLAVCLLAVTGPAHAALKLPAIFGDHMVLQQRVPVTVWGWADPNEAIQVTIGTVTANTTADAEGKWRCKLGKMQSTTIPITVTVSGATQKIVFADVLIGDVWICSGQSNMALSMSEASNAREVLPNANYPELRIFSVKVKPEIEPQHDCEGRWVCCSPEVARTFSAVGYLFGMELAKAKKLPLGLIGSYVGSSPAQAWTSLEALKSDPDLKSGYADGFMALTANAKAVQAAHDQWMANGGAAYYETGRQYNMAKYLAKEKGLPAPPPPPPPFPLPYAPEPPDFKDTNLPTVLFNAMIHPLIPYAIKGVIWYQGESNEAKPGLYRRLFSAMINDWRTHWSQGDFLFLYVQLPGFRVRQPEPASGGGWPLVRETQMLALKSVPQTGMAIAIDCGEGNNLHPSFKSEIGRRLSLLARRMAYGEDLVASGPLYESHQVAGNKIKIVFSSTGTGLKIGVPPKESKTPVPPVDEIKGFAIAGPDGKFVWAKATIGSPNTVVVWSDQIKNPTAVRYGWAENPEVNLYNSADLPASPFRTDAPASLPK